MKLIEDIKFKILCDNYLEFERFFEIALESLDLKKSHFTIERRVPIKLINNDLNISFEVFVGFGRWGDNYWQSTLNKSLYINENPDVLVSIENKNLKKLFAIEFCSALPAGNQAWQRFARGKEFSENGTDYFFVSHLGGVELGKDRREKSIRFPNPIVNFASNQHNIRYDSGLFINLIESTPGCPQHIIANFENCIGLNLLKEYIRNIIMDTVPNENVLEHQKKLIKKYVNTKIRCSPFEDDLKNDRKNDHNKKVTHGWKKRYSIEIKDITKKILDVVSECSNAYYGKDLPFVLIDSQKRELFCQKLNTLLNTNDINFDEEEDIFFCAFAGFKPRGDDARPDRGLVPLLDSLVGNKNKIITLVFGPAMSSVEIKLISDHESVCFKNGLWGSVFQYSDLVISSSKKFKKTLVLKGDRKKKHRGAEEFVFSSNKINLIPNENDVDSAIHITFINDCLLFESMFNPPGGDWSGVSFFNENINNEIKYLSLPRAPDARLNKRPDHIYHDYKNQNIFVIESKTTFTSLNNEENVGEKMINWVNTLINFNPQIKKLNNDIWTSDVDSSDCLENQNFYKCGAIKYKDESSNSLKLMMEKCNLDFLFLYILRANNWKIKMLPKNSDISIPECLNSLDHLNV